LILKVCIGHDVYQNANEPFRSREVTSIFFKWHAKNIRCNLLESI
jgi:hypothetical protein